MRPFSLSLSMLLLSLSLASAQAVATSPAASAPASLQEQAQQAAYDRLTQLAKRAGLDDTRIVVTVPPLKPPMPTCDSPFDITLGEPRQLGRLGISARCPSSGRVTKFVARARVTATIPVMARDIDARQPISRDDLTAASRALSSLTDTVTRPDDALGKTSRRALRAGQVLSRRLLEAPELIRRGQTVRLVAHLGQAEIVNTGVAMQAGAAGDVIRLRVGTRAQSRVVEARVIGPGTVEPIVQPAPDAAR